MQSFLRRYGLEIIIHLLFWVLLLEAINSLTTLTVKYLQDIHQPAGNTVKNSLYPLSYIFLFFLMLLFYINSFWLFTTRILKNNYYPVLLSVVFAAVWYGVNYFLVHHFISYSTLTASQWRDLQGNVLLIFGFIWGLSLTYFFSKAWIKNELLKKKIESNRLATELNFLKAQINPHFLFNTLNNFFSMAQEKENNELANGISQLSQMMRYMIYESNTEKVPLEKEIDFLKSCIALNKLRFRDNEAIVHFSYPENCNGALIAPMLFIPFVENAFKYGVLINEKSEITIAVELSDLSILFSCENNDYSCIQKMNEELKGIGLSNVSRRLDLLYPEAHCLQIKTENKKYSVVLQLNQNDKVYSNR